MKISTWPNELFKKLFYCDKWNIGYVSQTPENLILTRKINGNINWLPEDVPDYAADPFPVIIDGNMFIYYEELNFWSGKGQIVQITNKDFKSKRKVTGIGNQRLHLSYPYIFTAKNELYCIPETAQAKQVSLYHINKSDTLNFKKLKVILEGEAFVDSSIIYFNNKYWLFTSVSGINGELYIFYSEDLESPFSPHLMNPIKVPVDMGRCAGQLFTVGTKLYRPSQNPRKGYGGSIMINEITAISVTEFKYVTAFELLPQQPYDKGFHTIGFAGDIAVFDGKRKVFSPLLPLKKAVAKIRNLNSRS